MIEFETDDRLGLGEFGIQTRVVAPEQRAGVEPSIPSPVPAPDEEASGRTMIYSTAGRVAEPLEERARARHHTALLILDGRRLVIGPTGAMIGRSRSVRRRARGPERLPPARRDPSPRGLVGAQ